MPETLISVDLRRSPEEQQPRPHNRWHPEIPPVVTVEPGSVFRVECLDATGGQIVNSDSAEDVRDLDLGQMLYLSGPIAVEGSRPGDLLVVEVLEIGPLAGAEWGYTVILDRSVGAGLLADDFPEARKAIWDLDGVFASSRHLGGVRFAGVPHPGVIGCAPSAELLARWNRREQIRRPDPLSGLMQGLTCPGPQGAVLGGVGSEETERIAREAARTWAARENGGSSDVRAVTRGSRIVLPVFVPGANLSVGDLQFSQGDGTITGFGGIRMAGWIDLQVEVIRDGMARYGIDTPVFEPGSVMPSYCESIVFRGIATEPVGTHGELDIRAAYAQACRGAVAYLERYGYSGEQAYVLLAAAPVEGRINSLFDPPSACCSVSVPIKIFDFEFGASLDGGPSAPRGELARP